MESRYVSGGVKRVNSVDTKAESNLAVKPKTPRRRPKAIRTSEPGLPPSSGLTPMIRRTSVATPKSRPARDKGPDALHQARVERRSRRSGLRDALSKLEQEKRRKESIANAEIAILKQQVEARDQEIYQLQNATIIFDTERIWNLEQQIVQLKSELSRKTRDSNVVSNSCAYSWKTAVPDPFVDDAFIEMSVDEEHFGSVTMAQLQASTPERVKSSFLTTPPSTSPVVPATPSLRFSSPTAISHAAVQAEVADSSKGNLEAELALMQREMDKLTATLDSYINLGTRLKDILSDVTLDVVDEIATPPIEAIEGQVKCLLQTMADQAMALSHLTSAIADLGFPGADASEMLASLASGLRAARLELEYLTPGEIALPLTSHGADLLDLLLNNLRLAAKRAKADENAIDEYHALEQSLRKQMASHQCVLEGLKAEMAKAQKLVDDRDNKIKELEIGNDRLKGAVAGYIRDISELESLVQQMERESRNCAQAHRAELKTRDDLLLAKDISIADLEDKIAEAVTQTAELLKEMSDQEYVHKRQAVLLNRQHGPALALCDARVAELRVKMAQVNESLWAVHETICHLRAENSELKTRMDHERVKAKATIDSMKEELRRVLQMSQSFVEDAPSMEGGKRARETSPDNSSGTLLDEDADGGGTQRESKKMRISHGFESSE